MSSAEYPTEASTESVSAPSAGAGDEEEEAAEEEEDEAMVVGQSCRADEPLARPTKRTE